MTRTTKTAAAAPAPRNGRNGKVRTIKVNPETLASADLSAAELPEDVAQAMIEDAIAQPIDADAMIGRSLLDGDMLGMLAEAQAEEEAARQSRKSEPIARVSLTPTEGAAMAALGWLAPRVDANLTVAPKPISRVNACKGGAAYRVALLMLSAGPLHITKLAALWSAANGGRRPLNSILQQLANRAGRPIKQDAALITFAD